MMIKNEGSSMLASNSVWEVAPPLVSARRLSTTSVPPVLIGVYNGVGQWCLCFARGSLEPKP